MIEIFFVIALIGGLIGIAYYLDRRRKNAGPIGPALPEIGPVGRLLLWVGRILVVLMVLSIVGAFVFRSGMLFSITVGCLLLYIVVGVIYRVMRVTGK